MADNDFVVGLVFGGCLSVLGLLVYVVSTPSTLSYSRIKQPVAQGYLNPKDLEFRCMDFKNIGDCTTVLRYKGKQYLFRLDDKLRLIIEPYQVVEKPECAD